MKEALRATIVSEVILRAVCIAGEARYSVQVSDTWAGKEC